MTDIEDRLRRDLDALADALTGMTVETHDGGAGRPVDRRPAHTSPGGRRDGRWAIAAAACAAVALVAVLLVGGDDTRRTAVDAVDRSQEPSEAGMWEAIPAAPIAPRAYPVSMWTGTEALFWAGSSLDRGFAYGDAAAYDPSAETWRAAPEPGWGHPGLVSVEVDGRLFATAKGSIGHLDVETGEWVQLPPFDQITVRSIAAGDGGLWAMGPRPGDPKRLGVAFYDTDSEEWTDGDDLDGPAAAAALEALADLGQPVLWTGRVVVWAGQQGFAYDPDSGWATLPPPSGLDADVVATRAVADERGLVLLAESVVDGRHVVRAWRSDASGAWTAIDGAELPVEDLDRTTITKAGEWIVLLPPEGSPVTLHPGSRVWHEHPAAPMRGVEGPGTVWTGTQLIVWGGVPAESSDDTSGTGMIWTPPAVAAPEGGTDTTTPETSGHPAEPSWSGPSVAELPSSGIAVAEDGELVLHDFSGNELARATTPAITDLQSSSDRLVAEVRTGEVVDAVPTDVSETPDGCASAATAGGVRVALCGGEPQQPQRIERVSPTGARHVIAVVPEDSNGLGHWRSAIPSPDGRWVLATWSGECETQTAMLLPAAGDAPGTTVDGRSRLAGATESSGVGWTPEGRAIVQMGTGVCGAAAEEPGVHLVEPDTLDHHLVIGQPRPGPSVHLWRVRPHGNDAEWIFFTALEELGLEGCCGEPSHGGQDLTAGVRWEGFDIPVGATPPGATDAVPFNDLVLSSEPIELDGAPAVAGEADLGRFVSYRCGDRVWTFGGAGTGDRATADAVRSVAATVLPYLGCTVGERPLATGHGPGGP